MYETRSTSAGVAGPGDRVVEEVLGDTVVSTPGVTATVGGGIGAVLDAGLTAGFDSALGPADIPPHAPSSRTAIDRDASSLMTSVSARKSRGLRQTCHTPTEPDHPGQAEAQQWLLDYNRCDVEATPAIREWLSNSEFPTVAVN